MTTTAVESVSDVSKSGVIKHDLTPVVLLGGAANSDPRDQGAAEEATAITALPAIQPGDLVLEVSGARICDVRFHLPRASWASLHVYSVTGTLVATIFAGNQPAGSGIA